MNGSPKLITRSQSIESRSPLRRQALDCCDRTDIAPIIRVEAALCAPLDAHILILPHLLGLSTFPAKWSTAPLAIPSQEARTGQPGTAQRGRQMLQTQIGLAQDATADGMPS